MGWIKDVLGAAAAIHEARKAGVEGSLLVVPEQELWEDKLWLTKRNYENRLMQRCIVGTTMGGGDGSICQYCEEHAEGACHKDAYMKKGCTEWWLRFLTKEEDERCEQATKKTYEQFAAQGNPGENKEPDPDGADEKRDNPGGSDKVIQGRF